MKFSIYSTRHDESPEQLLEQYPVLEQFDYEIETKTVEYRADAIYGTEYITNEIYICVDIKSIEQLTMFINAVGHSIVISEHPAINCRGEYCIEIYDDWRE